MLTKGFQSLAAARSSGAPRCRNAARQRPTTLLPRVSSGAAAGLPLSQNHLGTSIPQGCLIQHLPPREPGWSGRGAQRTRGGLSQTPRHAGPPPSPERSVPLGVRARGGSPSPRGPAAAGLPSPPWLTALLSAPRPRRAPRAAEGGRPLPTALCSTPAEAPAASPAAGPTARSRKWRPLPSWRASASLPAVQNGGGGGPEPSIAEPPWSRGAGPRAPSQWASARGLEATNGERRRCRAAPRVQWERRELGAQSSPARLGAALRRAGAEAAVSCPGAWWSDGGIVGKFLGEVRI